MKIKEPQPFTFEAGPRAVLLLHGFTGNSADVRMLGRFLEKRGYTSHAPIYKGHGKSPEELIKTDAEEYYQDVEQAIAHLRELGYAEIAVAGLSIGGVFALRLASSDNIKGVIPMCAPMIHQSESGFSRSFKWFVKRYKKMVGADESDSQKEADMLDGNAQGLFKSISKVITHMKDHIDSVDTPLFVVQGSLDDTIDTDSASFIYEQTKSDKKEIKWYEHSGHVITLDKEKEQVYEDIYQFLENLDWKA